MNRKREQAEMYIRLGQLYGPLLKMIQNPESYDSEERTRILARYYVDAGVYYNDFQKYANGEPGHSYRQQIQTSHNAYAIMCGYAGAIEEKRFSETVMRTYQDFFDSIYSIPVPLESAIHEAHSPFSTYRLVRDLCSTANQKIVWMDRYFDQTLFSRYFADTPRTTQITLITYPESKCQGAKDKQRFADFLGISRLSALERGPTGYRLLVDEHFHDRRLQCDSKMFAIGGSIKEVGTATSFTITKLDTSLENQKVFDDDTARAKELFGPTQPTHP